ncbi:hypothetical protein EVAR_35533_1 [Eumeta japonica]|uniref:Helitron helicase-like domain-containing protein n=1 Tax=Eumeta variegata TaxID=151549 RepID=A0A4C1X8U0_EUMVA|nr:hypothetical protein EVAR_35533_1 [Eumeta japonica]
MVRGFRQKIQSLMNYIVKHRVFGDTRFWMYSIEWKKRDPPHAYILIWLVERIQPNQIDDIICAEILDHEADPDLFDVVVTNMIHGPCGAINPKPPCMFDGKCSKRYPRTLTAETVTGNNGSDMTVFSIQTSNTNDEIARCQVGRYVNCNEAIWHIYTFPIHECHPIVVHLVVHLENGQRVYFTTSDVVQRAETPSAQY